MYSNPWGSEFGTWHLSLTKCQIIILFSSFEFKNRSHGGKSKFDVEKWGVMRFSHRKVTFEMLENHEIFEIRGFYDEIDIWWYPNWAEKINKAIKNIIWLFLYYILIKNCQQMSKMTKTCQKSYKILWNSISF